MKCPEPLSQSQADCTCSQTEGDALWHLVSLLDRIDESQPVILVNWNGPAGQATPQGHIPSLKDDRKPPLQQTQWSASGFLRVYFKKMLGTGQKPPKRDGIKEIVLSFFGSFLSLAILGAIDFYFLLDTRFTALLPAFSAMAVILFTDIGSRGPLAQPRNTFFGHLLSAVIGLICQTVIRGQLRWISGPLSVAVTIALMSLTHTVHPAAGATALACIYGGPRIKNSGWWFALLPVTLGSIMILVITLLVNNLSPRRRYPLYWY